MLCNKHEKLRHQNILQMKGGIERVGAITLVAPTRCWRRISIIFGAAAGGISANYVIIGVATAQSSKRLAAAAAIWRWATRRVSAQAPANCTRRLAWRNYQQELATSAA